MIAYTSPTDAAGQFTATGTSDAFLIGPLETYTIDDVDVRWVSFTHPEKPVDHARIAANRVACQWVLKVRDAIPIPAAPDEKRRRKNNRQAFAKRRAAGAIRPGWFLVIFLLWILKGV